jgi:hypothetical protein
MVAWLRLEDRLPANCEQRQGGKLESMRSSAGLCCFKTTDTPTNSQSKGNSGGDVMQKKGGGKQKIMHGSHCFGV